LALRFLEDGGPEGEEEEEEKQSSNRRFIVALTERKTDTLSKTLRVFSLSPFPQDESENWARDHDCVRLPQWIAFVRRFANIEDLRGQMVIERRDDKLDLASSFPSDIWSDLELHNEDAALLAGTRWFDDADRRVVNFLKRQGQLKRLKLAMVNTVEAEELCNALPGTLTELNVFRCYMPPWSCRSVDSLVAHCPRLRILDMQSRSDYPCWTKPFAQIPRLLEKLPHLERLVTSVGHLRSEEDKSAYESMAAAINDMAHVQHRLFDRVSVAQTNELGRWLSTSIRVVGACSSRENWIGKWI